MTKEPLTPPSTPVSFADYVELNDTNADRTTDFLTAFSFLDYPKPTISFKTPPTTPATIRAASKLELNVTGFSIGGAATDDGIVGVTFAGGAGCTNTTINVEVPMKGSGTVELLLPATCLGAGIVISAALLKDATTALSPPISASITATIQ